MNAPARIIDTPERLRLTVEDFLLLNNSGAFDAYSRSELLDGDIYVMNAQYCPHARALSRLMVAIAAQLRDSGSELEPIVGVSVHAAADSMPEPDIVLTDWRGSEAVPAGAISLVVEVSSTTRYIDLGRKAAIYGRAGIPEYWVIDLADRVVKRHVAPAATGYDRVDEVAFGDALDAVTLPGLAINTAGLFT